MNAPSIPTDETQALKAGKYLAVAGLCIGGYDWLISLGPEYNRIWRGGRKWTLARVLYVFTRYWGLMATSVSVWLSVGASLTHEECKHLYRLNVALPQVTFLTSEAVLALRTYAFCDRNKWLLATVLTMLAGEVAYAIYVIAKGVDQVPIATPTGICAASGPPGGHTNLVTGLFIAPVIFDFILTLLTLEKAYQLWRAWLRSNKTQLFVREGLAYFLVITSLNIINLGFFTQSNQGIQAVIALPTIQLSSSLASLTYFPVPQGLLTDICVNIIQTCRLILSLLHPRNVPTSVPSSSVTTSTFFSSTGFETKQDMQTPPINEDTWRSTLDWLSQNDAVVKTDDQSATRGTRVVHKGDGETIEIVCPAG